MVYHTSVEVSFYKHYNNLGDDPLILRVGGGGALAHLVGTDYLFSSRDQPENLFPGIQRTEYLFSTATNFWNSKKKKKTSATIAELVRLDV